jgi:hypothetical protein
MFYLNKKIKQLVNNQGEIPNELLSKVDKCISEAESTAILMLGCTLSFKGRSFIITSLELYYGGIADDAQDWYRSKGYKNTTEHSQTREGLVIYLHKNSLISNY